MVAGIVNGLLQNDGGMAIAIFLIFKREMAAAAPLF